MISFCKHLLLIGFASSVLFAAARAELDQESFALFEKGAFEAAAEMAALKGGAENYALAARSLNARAYLEEENDRARKIAAQALDYAEKAIDDDPALVEGYLEAAISLAQRGARMAPWRAFLLNLAQRARDDLDQALLMEPENAWALSTSAAWHLEVSRRGGEGSFGSDPAIGRQQFLTARNIDPENILIAYECALRLIAYGRREWRDDGLEALRVAIALNPADAFEEAIQTRAHAFDEAIQEGGEAERTFIKTQP